MVDVVNFPVNKVWDCCDPTVEIAIGQFHDRWRPYSASSRGKRIDRLIQEVIDPAVATYLESLPQRYLSYVPGAGTGVAFSDIIRLVGLKSMARAQHQLLRAFVSTQADNSSRDRRFIATLETLLDVVRACAIKPPLKSKLRDTRLNGRRIQEFCRFCGAPAELTSFAAGCDDLKLDNPDEMSRLSSVYCADHRPRLPNGEWNPAYRKAKRSLGQFDTELARLTRQSGNWREFRAQSGDPLVDRYIFHFVGKHYLRPADEMELRHHARRMADAKLSDRKKQMVILQRDGVSQSEIARRLGIERQAVSKALATIPSDFRQLSRLRHPHHIFFGAN